MRRIWLDKSEIDDHAFDITGEAYRHAILVSRFQVGEEFEIVFGGNEALRVKLTEIKKKHARVEVLGKRALPETPKPWVHLAFAVTKWPVFEEVIEKSVELGVQSVQPLLTEFSFVRSKKDWPENRIARFQKIIQSATVQSGRGSLLTIREPLTLKELVDRVNLSDSTKGLFCYEGQASLDIRSALKAYSQEQLQEIWAIVGSEGGFSQAEVEFMTNAHWPPVTMGKQVLRAETACFAMVSVIKYELGLMS